MAQEARLVVSVAERDAAAARAAGGRGQGAFDTQDELVVFVDLGLEDAEIGDVERYGDERVLGHQRLSLHVLVSHGAILSYLDLRRNPYM